MLMKQLLLVVFGIIVGTAVTLFVFFIRSYSSARITTHHMPFQVNIVKATADNQNFRQVLFTGAKSQLVVMSIPPGGEIGQETHPYVEQVLYFQSGTGEAILDGKTTEIGPGDIVVVPPDTQHNFINTGKVPLQIFTMYAPPNHIDGRIQHTIQDEEADTADEAFGDLVR